MEIMPLDSWILQKIGAADSILTQQTIHDYQLGKLRETIDYARLRSPFYSRLLANISTDSFSLSHISKLPFTTAEDIRRDSRQFVALPPHEISRIVTLHTSGTTGQSKRFYFTKEDIDRTIDFFGSGMSILVEKGWKVLILLPGEKPDSVGDLLSRGLKQIGVESFIHGPIHDVQSSVDEILARRIDSLVGIPIQVLSLARSSAGKAIPRDMIKSVLLSADYVPSAIVDELVSAWDCPVFKHYGMTEMGLGGAVECHERDGYHLREADLYFEIVDPNTSQPLKNGEIGEIVITTLTRKGMPLIRYRTGDLSRFVSEPCSCGSAIKRIGTVEGRLDGRIVLSNGGILTLSEIDETLFRIEGLLNYSVVLTTSDGSDYLEITTHAEEDGNSQKVLHAIKDIPIISKALACGSLKLAPIAFSQTGWYTTGVAKRMIRDCRNQPSGEIPLL
jgi:phenylacetate-CoA ligase